jgi:hypothetical protein
VETVCSAVARIGLVGEPALTKVNLCSSSSADRVGKGGNWKALGAAADRSSALALRSPGLMNSTLGWVKTAECAFGELGEGDGVDEEEVETDAERSEPWLAEPGRWNTGTTVTGDEISPPHTPFWRKSKSHWKGNVNGVPYIL